MRQRRPSAPAASGAGAGRAPALMPARGAGPRLWGPGALSFVAFAVLLPVSTASPTTTGQDRVHQQLATPEGRKHSLSDKWCPPGSHVSEDGKKCIYCTSGVDYTIHWNKLSSCLPCTICKSGKEERVPCIRTNDTQCQCKPGTFYREDSPEFCQKCSIRCPDGMVEAGPCTPWSDLKCVKREPGTQAIGEAPVPGEPVTKSLGPPTAPSPSSASSQLVTRIALATVCVQLLMLAPCLYYWRRFLTGCGVDPECVNTVFSWCSCPRRGPGAPDNARKEIMNNSDSLSTLASEQELGHQEHAELAGVIIQSPAEAEHLLGSAGAEGFRMRRGLLVPANGADPIESLRLSFNYFPSIVPFNSWNPLMRLVGLTDNDIYVARARALDPREALYEMLVTWLSNRGRAASVNTLLDALETLGERNAIELIQDHLVDSGKYVYEEGGAGSSVS